MLGRSQRRSVIVEIKRRKTARETRGVGGRPHGLYGSHCDLERRGRNLSTQHGGTEERGMIVSLTHEGGMYPSLNYVTHMPRPSGDGHSHLHSTPRR